VARLARHEVVERKALRTGPFDGQRVADETRFDLGIGELREAALVGVDSGAEIEIVEIADLRLARRDPQQRDFAAVEPIGDEPAVEAFEERLGEGAGLSARCPIRLVQYFEAVEKGFRLCRVGRVLELDGSVRLEQSQ